MANEMKRAAVAFLWVAIAMTSCGGDPRADGGLCARCSPGDPPCSTFTLLSEDQAATFCGDARRDQCSFCRRDVDDYDQDGLTDDIVCTVPLTCRTQINSLKARCYPLQPDMTTLITEYICDGEKPRP